MDDVGCVTLKNMIFSLCFFEKNFMLCLEHLSTTSVEKRTKIGYHQPPSPIHETQGVGLIRAPPPHSFKPLKKV